MKSEFETIAKIKSELVSTHSGLIQGIGDDCAVVDKSETEVFLITSDLLVENVHFDLKYFSFFDLGRKAMSVNVSDIAAMAGKPLYAFVSLAIPPKFKDADVTDLYKGLDQVAQQHSVAISGGDISSSPNYFFINVTLVGSAKRDQYKLRSHAKAGDGIYVSGTMGTAALGLKLCQKGRTSQNNYVQAIKGPTAQVSLALTLSEYDAVHAMIDVSDGLVADLHHVMTASQTECEIELDKIPQEEDFEEVCKSVRLKPMDVLLGGGEDYQLLFTLDDSQYKIISNKLSSLKNIKLSRIGEVKEGFGDLKPSVTDPYPRVVVLDENKKRLNVKAKGYEHF